MEPENNFAFIAGMTSVIDYRCQPRGPWVEKPGFFKKIRGRGPDRKPRRGRGFLFVHILY
jgi:hypothetical protein